MSPEMILYGYPLPTDAVAVLDYVIEQVGDQIEEAPGSSTLQTWSVIVPGEHPQDLRNQVVEVLAADGGPQPVRGLRVEGARMNAAVETAARALGWDGP